MAYFNKQEMQDRIAKVVKLLNEKDTDIAVIYFDELNIANGWYLTGWCGQFEKGAVLVGRDGTTMLLGDLIEMQFMGGAYNPHLGSAIALVMMIVVMICMAVMNHFGDGEDKAVML